MDVGKNDKTPSSGVQEVTSKHNSSNSNHTTTRNSVVGAGSDVVKCDSSEGVKVSNADCDTGAGGVKCDSVTSEGVKGGGGGKGGARSEQERRLWAAVKANSSDFTSWTALLQMVEQNVGIKGTGCIGCACVYVFHMSMVNDTSKLETPCSIHTVHRSCMYMSICVLTYFLYIPVYSRACSRGI